MGGAGAGDRHGGQRWAAVGDGRKRGRLPSFHALPALTHMNATRSDALELIRRVVAANCACRPEDFLEDGCAIVEAVLRPGRMPFHLGRPHIGLTTFGAGVVVTASAEWIPWARRVVGGLQRDDVFAPACLARIERHVQRSGRSTSG